MKLFIFCIHIFILGTCTSQRYIGFQGFRDKLLDPDKNTKYQVLQDFSWNDIDELTLSVDSLDYDGWRVYFFKEIKHGFMYGTRYEYLTEEMRQF